MPTRDADCALDVERAGDSELVWFATCVPYTPSSITRSSPVPVE